MHHSCISLIVPARFNGSFFHTKQHGFIDVYHNHEIIIKRGIDNIKRDICFRNMTRLDKPLYYIRFVIRGLKLLLIHF